MVWYNNMKMVGKQKLTIFIEKDIKKILVYAYCSVIHGKSHFFWIIAQNNINNEDDYSYM